MLVSVSKCVVLVGVCVCACCVRAACIHACMLVNGYMCWCVCVCKWLFKTFLYEHSFYLHRKHFVRLSYSIT